MGRAMLIIVSGVLLGLGFIGFGFNNQMKSVTELSSEYAKQVQSKNTAHTAIQLAMEQINLNPAWAPSQANPWTPIVDGAQIQLFLEVLSAGAGPLDPSVIRLTSNSDYQGTTHQVISTFQKTLLDFVPEFKSALSFATDQFNFSMSGSSSINGNDKTGTCTDLPGITTISAGGTAEVISGAGKNMDSIDGDPQVAFDPTLSYSPVDELIARLESMPGVVHLSGNYKGSLGTETEPGVFFVDKYTKLAGGIDNGYGIMVIRATGELDLEGELDIAGNLAFNGLVIFENAFSLSGRGTPTINGSVLVGNTQQTGDLDVDINGNLHIQYDCLAREYARMASARLLKQNRFSLISTFD